MKVIKVFFFFFSIFASSQSVVKLRDVDFMIPQKFKFVDKENVKVEYDLFYENGKISVDSTNTEFFPKIAYQYYENPGSTDDSKIVLKRLNEIMTKDFKPDTLVIDSKNDLSIAKYQIMGNSLFEIKSLGGNGWINIVYSDYPKNDNTNFKIVKEIAYSIHHNEIYNAAYKERMKNSGTATKSLIFALLFLVFITGIRKFMKKNAT